MSLYASIIRLLQTTPLSLADLLPLTQVSLPTLRKAVQELSEAYWIRVVGQSETQVGRPAMLFGLNDAHYLILGVHMQLPGIRLVLTNLAGDVLHEAVAYQKAQPTPDQAVQAILDYTAEVRTRFTKRQLLGVGIAMPGFTDPDSGDVLSIGRVPGWEQYPICQRLQTALGLPVRIANDVDCMAFAEFHASGKVFSDNLAYVGFDEGVKISMFLNGELYKGVSGNAGLVISRFLDVQDPAISPQERQQILTITGISQLFERRYTLLPADQRLPDYDTMRQASDRERVRLIFKGAEAGLPLCVEAMRLLNQVLSVAIADVLYIIQPHVTVIGGVLSALPEALFLELSMAIRQHLPSLLSNRLTIEQAQLSSINCAALGAQYHFLERYLLDEPIPQMTH